MIPLSSASKIPSVIPMQFSSEQPDFWSFSLDKLEASDKENLGIKELEGFSKPNQEKKFHNMNFLLILFA